MTLSKVRSIMKKYHIGTFLALNILFFSCTKQQDVANYQKYSDSEIFRGIIFLDGPVIGALGDFKDLSMESFTKDQAKIEKIRQMQTKIIDRILKENPSYLSDFRKSVTSGNYDFVRARIIDAKDKVLNALPEVENVSKKDLNSVVNELNAVLLNTNSSSKEEVKTAISNTLEKVQNEQSRNTLQLRSDTWKWVDTAVALYLVAAAAVAVVLVIVLVQQEQGVGTGGNFLREELLATITVNLHQL